MRTVYNSNNLDFRGDYRMLPAEPDTPFAILNSQKFKITDIDDSDVIITLGSDIIREHPNEYLRIRKAFNFNSPKIYSLMPYAVKSADIANLEIIYTVGTEEALISGICLAGVEENIVAENLVSELKQKLPFKSAKETAEITGVEVDHLKIIAHALAEGKKITIIIGEIVKRSKERESIAASLINLNNLFNIKAKGQMAVLARYANSKGAEKLGLLPKPQDKLVAKLKSLWGHYPEAEPKNTDAMMALIKKEEIKGFFIVGSNPVMLYPDRVFVKEGLEKLDFLVVCDMFETATTEIADVVLPIASWAEYNGDYVNLEGRNQTAEQAIKPVDSSKPVYEIIKLIAKLFNVDLFKDNDMIDDEMNQLLNIDTVLPIPKSLFELKYEAVPPNKEYPHPLFVIDDHNHSGHLTEKCQSLNNFAGEAYLEIARERADKYHLKNGDNVRVESEIGKIIVPVKISEFIDNDAVLIPRNFPSTPVTSLLMRKLRIDRVKITRVDE